MGLRHISQERLKSCTSSIKTWSYCCSGRKPPFSLTVRRTCHAGSSRSTRFLLQEIIPILFENFPNESSVFSTHLNCSSPSCAGFLHILFKRFNSLSKDPIDLFQPKVQRLVVKMVLRPLQEQAYPKFADFFLPFSSSLICMPTVIAKFIGQIWGPFVEGEDVDFTCKPGPCHQHGHISHQTPVIRDEKHSAVPVLSPLFCLPVQPKLWFCRFQPRCG